MILRTINLGPGQYLDDATLARSVALDEEVVATSARIVSDVRARGDEALAEYTERFDGVSIDDFRVADVDIAAAYDEVDPELVEAIRFAAASIRDFHARQIEQSWFTTQARGVLLGSKVTPLDSAGIYVPGGRALYPSTVLMNAIPASVAGVERIAMVVPPRPDGSVDAASLVAADIAGVTEVYRVGGAQAIAALAYGTAQIARVDKITGPGNAYVAAAKKLVHGDVGIDMIAGPSEVLVLADETAEPSLVAIDLMAQAEHDPDAACYLVTTDPSLPALVDEALAILLAISPRRDITEASLSNNGVAIVTDDIDVALHAVNLIAPEHLEVLMDEPLELLGSIRNAGAIFLGPWTPESVGDYVAGPNHTLPTSGTARFSSPLSTADFQKHSSVISYSWQALVEDGEYVTTIAEREGLWAHGKAVELRLELAEVDDEEEVDA